jgi:hypothetical protein
LIDIGGKERKVNVLAACFLFNHRRIALAIPITLFDWLQM